MTNPDTTRWEGFLAAYATVVGFRMSEPPGRCLFPIEPGDTSEQAVLQAAADQQGVKLTWVYGWRQDKEATR